MIDSQTATIGILFGCVLISLGLVRGLFQGLTQGVTEAIRNFEDRLLFLFHRSWTMPRVAANHNLRRPIWLAGLGVGLIVLSVLAALSG